ncbi:hypothetical protein BDZ94DRAFT_1298991 [Collybia nuda]|uniref:Uncharacterized protein n=1 Tax=Collybia nuda TaxID=64659 RepID=A0A9P5Y666_9AGAR|nr:hypothetical protein BDZ94DRAFT_1298991 [Collybia nuda]
MRYSSRKYIDLIHSTSSKWANWDPPHQIRVWRFVGDYGVIDKETGVLDKEGNIYDDPATAELVMDYLPIEGAQETKFIISSFGVRYQDLRLEPGIQLPAGLAEASIRGQWQFGKRRGALLIMSQPRSQHIPSNTFLKDLIGISKLKDKALVTEVVSCPAYSLYLSGANEETISIALIAGVPGIVPVATIGGEVGMSWWSRYSSGLFREACDNAGKFSYTPLYALRKIRKPSLLRRRGSHTPDPEGDEVWGDYPEPWGDLDEDGEEEEFEDEVYD